jgi:peptidoglycan/LPS O-acetylase OafA/YrhL
MQRPILRLVAQGNAWVAVFFVLLGYVNSLKCLTQSRAGEVDAALSTLASSSFRKTGRLIFPAAAVTILAWFACQLGAFRLALVSDAYWLRSTSPEQSDTWASSVLDLGRELVYTWFFFNNKYDQPQWALQFLFKASMLVFVVLLVTVRTTPRFRLFTELILYAWYWSTGEFLVGTNVIAGMMLAELTMCEIPAMEYAILKCVPFLSALLGLFLMSFPSEFHEWASWSHFLHDLGLSLFPRSSLQDRAWSGVGAQILCYSICVSPALRQALSHRCLLWFGSVSYSLYLLHGPLMRSVLTWLVYGPMLMEWVPGVGEDLISEDADYVPAPGPLLMIVVLPIFWTFLLFAVHLWSVKVEPKFAVATKWMEDFAIGSSSGFRLSEKSIPLYQTHHLFGTHLPPPVGR